MFSKVGSLAVVVLYLQLVAAEDFYVESSICPGNSNCRNISYYINNYYFASPRDAVFYLAEGTHYLERELTIISASNVTLKGLGSQSNVIIDGGGRYGVWVEQGHRISLIGITLTNCINVEQEYGAAALLAYKVYNLTILLVSIVDAPGSGAWLSNCFNLYIMDSSFLRNGRESPMLESSSLLITYDATGTAGTYITEDAAYDIYIARSNISHSYSTGLFVTSNYDYNFHFTMDHTLPSGNALSNAYLILQYCRCSAIVTNCIVSDSVSQSMTIFFNSKNSFVIENTRFLHNTVEQAPLTIIWEGEDTNGEVFLIRNCTILNNRGAFHGIIILPLEICLNCSVPTFSLVDVLVTNDELKALGNMYEGGAIIATCVDISLENVTVSNNPTTGLHASSSLVRFRGDNYFINNTGIDGGGVALYSSSIIIIDRPNSTVFFLDNHALERGGAIYVSKEIILYDINTYCFYYGSHGNTLFYFSGNSADTAGDILYGEHILNCQDFAAHTDFSRQTGPSLVTSDVMEVCFCVDNRPDCGIKEMNMSVAPGVGFVVSVAGIGQLNYTTTATLQVFQQSTGRRLNFVGINATCTDIRVDLADVEPLTDDVVHITHTSSYGYLDKTVSVTILDCPHGFQLRNGKCDCNDQLNNFHFTCDIATNTISCSHSECLKTWINTSECGPLIANSNCPYGYCTDNYIQFSIDNPDAQCKYNRSGLLCGQCATGYSLMLGSNRCAECDGSYHILLVLFPMVVGGVTLVLLLIFLNLTVSVGTINGVIFYANIVGLYNGVVFPNGPIPFLTTFISWLNLDLGVEMCFYSGSNACSKAWLSFLFPVYLWALLAAIVILARRFSKFSQLIGRNAVSVLATLVLVSYTNLICGIIQSLSILYLECVGIVWSIDPNASHSYCYYLLVAVSGLILVLLIIPYTILLLVFPLMEGYFSKYRLCSRVSNRFKPLFDAYGGPYKDRYRCWTGILVLVRVLLALVIALDPYFTVSLDILTITVTLLLMIYFFVGGVYINKWNNYLDMFLFINIALLSHFVSSRTSENAAKSDVFIIALVSVAAATFVVILVYHIWKQIRKFLRCLKLTNKLVHSTESDSRAKVVEEGGDVGDIPLVAPTSTEIPSPHELKKRETLIELMM